MDNGSRGIINGLGLIHVVLNFFLVGVVISYLFNWFLSSIFNFTLGYWQAVGIGLLIDLATLPVQIKLSEHCDDTFGAACAREITYTYLLLIIWGIAALVHLAM